MRDSALQIRLSRESGSPPLSLQIRYSLEYAIGFGELAPGGQLPSVRELACQLGVAPNTVASAYQDLQESGLLVAKPGSGTFVSETLGDALSVEARESALYGVLSPAISSARDIGFSRREIVQAVHEILEEEVIGFVGSSQIIADKWSDILEHSFSGVRVVRVTLNELRNNPTDVLHRLEGTSRVLTALSLFTEVRDLLQDYDKSVTAVLSHLSPRTREELAALPREGAIGLICRDYFVSSLSGLLSAYVDPRRIRRVAPKDNDGIRNLATEAAVIVHTLACADRVTSLLADSEATLLQLEFIPDEAGFDQLSVILRKDWGKSKEKWY